MQRYALEAAALWGWEVIGALLLLPALYLGVGVAIGKRRGGGGGGSGNSSGGGGGRTLPGALALHPHASFLAALPALVADGFAFALAKVRGGGGKGRRGQYKSVTSEASSVFSQDRQKVEQSKRKPKNQSNDNCKNKHQDQGKDQSSQAAKFKKGEQVEYMSSSANKWIAAVVTADEKQGKVTLDVKKGAKVSAVRRI